MTQAAFEPVAASRRLQSSGFAAKQAKAVVETVSEVSVFQQQFGRDLADLKSFIKENMITRDDLKDFATRDDLKDFATRDDLKAYVTREMLTADLAVLKANIFRFGFIATGIVVTLIVGLASMIAAISVAALWQ